MVFFVLNVVFAATIFLFLPESSGCSLEEIDDIIMGASNRLFVVDRTGRLRPGFRSQYKRGLPVDSKGHYNI